MHTDIPIAASVSFYRSHKERLSTVHVLRGTGKDRTVYILESHIACIFVALMCSISNQAIMTICPALNNNCLVIVKAPKVHTGFPRFLAIIQEG